MFIRNYCIMGRLHLSDDEKSNIGCLAIIGIAIIFIIVFLIIKGFSWANVGDALVLVSASFWGIVGLLLGLFAIPAIIVFYGGLSNSLKIHEDKNSKWIAPLLNATFFVLLYGLFQHIFGDVFYSIVDYLDIVEDVERLSSLLSFFVFDIFVFLGCLYLRKHPDYTISSLID